MIDVAFDHVSKRYEIRRPGPDGNVLDPHGFWALRDVTFEVPHGETLGIIGHNGAGKSTALKLLSRITAPTEGTITLRGRLAALIEVGSGFHPELTGRENVFLSGAILGMKRREIAAKLDAIVEFSGVAPFIDVPVKWYSSGMYVRLGFSIAAYLEADILLVDEVLAVGDAAFQLRCYERIGELRRRGTTLLFISHDLASVERLCDRVVLMDHGRAIAAGTPRDIIREYRRTVDAAEPARVVGAGTASSRHDVQVVDVTFADGEGRDVSSTATGRARRARVHMAVAARVPDAIVELFYYSRDGRVLHCQQSTAIAGDLVTLQPGHHTLEFTCEEFGLQPGVYAIGASVRGISRPEAIAWWYGSRLLYVEPGKTVRGNFYAPHAWRWADALDGQRRPADV
jgi:ABC-type polysaccharide/polyol phosphate transport system ATPase subunit